MAVEKFSSGELGTPGPFIAQVTNNLDPTYMGGLEVVLRKGIPNLKKSKEDTFVVKYISPFYGVTSKDYEGTNSSNFNDVQKSYGMWMVPPDIGAYVLVIFIDGDPNQGYWFGCIPHENEFQNHMVPGIAASKLSAITNEQRQKYGTDLLPVAEFLKGTQRLENSKVNTILKPVHPFADRLLAQGLLLDTVRGVTSSSARREVPSSVFGISTPGPVDTSPGAKRGKIGYEGNRQAPVSRLGGHTFVMDDGDINGQNELLRIRTRTGHQILLHNSQDLIYIGNSKGTAWIELTSNGKIDIFATDSVSLHTEADFNLRADRDLNIEAGRNINIRALKNMETNVSGHYFLVVDDLAKIAVKNDLDQTIGQNHKLTIGNDFNLSVAKKLVATSGGDMELGTAGVMKQASTGNFNIASGGNYFESASKIHMNGPAAETPGQAQTATLPPLLPTYRLPNRNPGVGWANGSFYKKGVPEISSIMQRVPTHEPYDQHENVNPQQFSSAATDAGLQSRASSGVADSSNSVGLQTPANSSAITPGTCDPTYAATINNPRSQAGIAALKEAAKKLGLTSPVALASLLGIAGGETRWLVVEESFNYTTPERLLQVFPSVFKGDVELAKKYVGNPNNSLPEFLYGPQTSKGQGLGNVNPGDGAKYIGRGFIGITGRSNYTRYGKLLFDRGLISSPIALVDNPKLLMDIKLAAEVSVVYLLDRVKLNQDDPGYFEAAYRAVGLCTPDIYASKRGFYECFLSQLTAPAVQTGQGI